MGGMKETVFGKTKSDGKYTPKVLRTNALSPPRAGDQPFSNSPATNTSDCQSLTSHHRRSLTETQNTDSKWDQCASIRHFNHKHSIIQINPLTGYRNLWKHLRPSITGRLHLQNSDWVTYEHGKLVGL